MRAPDAAEHDRRREDASFTDFVAARLGHLTKLGRALAGDEQRGADLVQDALEKTFLHWATVREPEAYVRRLMVNRSISVWRKVRRERPLDAAPEPTREDRPADHDLWSAVRRLPPRQRAVIALRYYEDLTEVQTAELLNCSVGTVKSQASRAMATLRAAAATFDPSEDTP